VKAIFKSINFTNPDHPIGRGRTAAAAGARLAALSALLLALVGCGAGRPKPEIRSVAVARTNRVNLSNSMTFQGEFTAFQDVLIHAKVSGYVNPIRVDIGDRVKAGELLATLEVPELKDQLEGALASERSAKAEHELAHLNHERLVNVNKEHPNLVAQQDLDDAEAKDSSTEAALATAKADADRFSTLSDYTRVMAPFSGVITKRFVDNGTLVEAGTASNTGPIVELAESDLLRLRFPVAEAETPVVRIGGSVSIAVDALHRVFTGKIARDAGDIDRSTRTMIVEVDVPNPDDDLTAGMYASVTLSIQHADGVLAVPLQALSPGDSPTVLVVDKENTIEERPVVVGIRTAALAEIRSGLNEGDLVVVGERSGLAPGTAVAPKPVDPAASE
jgi:RND family efflux transporter MFP subunit